MIRNSRLLGIAFCIFPLWMAGCSSVQLPSWTQHWFESSVPQSKTVRQLKDAADWTDVAHDVAYRMMQKASQDKVMAAQEIRVLAPEPVTPFGQAFANALGSSLTLLGMKVSADEKAPLVLRLNIQPVSAAKEVIVNTALMDKQRFVFRSSDVYGFDTRLLPLYQYEPPKPEVVKPPTPVKEFKLTAGEKS
ncbi:hypothetical protein KSF73_11230 [Burkholderiaceae bacterium DAT-1]|nr:hypothetical protein [Burkholderiaceae bacterium DAT-1]